MILPLCLTPLWETEIIQALKSFKPIKALGPDGLHHLFYQKYWDILGPKTIDFYKKVFNNSVMPSQANKTLISLIPQGPDSGNLRNFRLIGLCNTIYKLVTKIIVNSMKPFLPYIINLFRLAS